MHQSGDEAARPRDFGERARARGQLRPSDNLEQFLRCRGST